MNTFVKLELFQTIGEVNFYTVRYLDSEYTESEYNEAERFVQKFNDSSGEFYEEFATILKLIEVIGENGALKRYFREEDAADALPGKPRLIGEVSVVKDSKLRWYARRLSEKIVILFNGDIKTTNGAEFCENVVPFFRAANKISRSIDEEMRDNHIIESYGELVYYDSDEDIILNI